MLKNKSLSHLKEKHQELGLLAKVLVEQHNSSSTMYDANKVLELLNEEYNRLQLVRK